LALKPCPVITISSPASAAVGLTDVALHWEPALSWEVGAVSDWAAAVDTAGLGVVFGRVAAATAREAAAKTSRTSAA
jgi:hypothetical protein